MEKFVDLPLFCKRRARILAQRAKLNETRRAETKLRTSLVRPATFRLAAVWVSNLAFQGKNIWEHSHSRHLWIRLKRNGQPPHLLNLPPREASEVSVDAFFDRTGTTAGLDLYGAYKGRTRPVMGLHSDPLVGPADLS